MAVDGISAQSSPRSAVSGEDTFGELLGTLTSERNGAAVSTVADVLQNLASSCGPAVYGRLRREGIFTAKDLAGLDKGDLRELGLGMLDRSRVLRWARFSGDAVTSSKVASPSSARTMTGSTPVSPSLHQAVVTSSSEQRAGHPRGIRTNLDSPEFAAQDIWSLETPTCERQEEMQRRLDEVEQRADFWCGIVTSASQASKATPSWQQTQLEWPLASQRPLSREHSWDEGSDLRENVLEELFDLSLERVEQLYNGMLRHSSVPGAVSVDALRYGLRRCGLSELDDAQLRRVVQAVKAQPGGHFSLREFEAILSRLKIAQLLCGVFHLPLDKDTLGGRRSLLGTKTGSCSLAEDLTVMDFSPRSASRMNVTKARQREFFFGHRKKPSSPGDPPLVRWVHMRGLDLTLLLALTVKYGLHPLGVEDVIDQCPTKMDRYGCHFFSAIEQLCLVSSPDGSEPVRVHGRHVTIFCSGAPLLDTILTVTEPDHDEREDWPGGPACDEAGKGDTWPERLRQRLEASHSRLRERRADFLMYQILDLSADELVKVTNAYTTRLSCLEGQPHITASGLTPEWLDEVSLSQMQLAVVARRLKGLQRLVRRLTEDADLNAGLEGYVCDVKDHIDEAHEDAVYLKEKCRGIIEASERTWERHHEYCRQRADDRLNSMVFILTVATAIFAPMTFMSAVYGMNFVDQDKTPTIPELLLPNGYRGFWIATFVYLLLSSCLAVYFYRRLQRKMRKNYQSIEGAGLAAARAPLGEHVAGGSLVAGGAAEPRPLMRTHSPVKSLRRG